MDVKVSVLTPAYNVEKYIGPAIESIISQDFKNFEYIIIDDCSTDNTWEIICDYAKKDKRIKAIQNKKNLGIAGNRNKGVFLAKGKYIVWQDADDISANDRISKQFTFLENNSEVGICGSYIELFSSKGSSSIRKYAPDDDTLRKNIFKYSPVAQPAAIIRKECFNEFGEYDLRWPPAEDLDMSFRIGTKYKFANIQEVLLRYREHDKSATYSRLRTIELNTIEIRKKYSNLEEYNMSVMNKIYNLLHYLSIFVVPARIKIKIFSLMRDKPMKFKKQIGGSNV